MEIPNDWRDCALPAVRAVLAEAATADFAWWQDNDTLWGGGQQRGYDVGNKIGRYDAKVVHFNEDGDVILVRRDGKPFDPARVDRMMLVHLDATTRYRVDFAGGTAELAARAEIQDAWDVPVKALNRIMPKHQDDNRVWHHVLLSPDALAEYRVR